MLSVLRSLAPQRDLMSKYRVRIIYVLLTLVTLAALYRVTNCGFLTGDDPLYVTKDPHIMNGVTWTAVRWIFTHIYANFWHPLTMISLMLDFQLYGLNPHGFHLTNLLLHIASTLLLFSALYRMTKARWRSAFVAALFAIHPLNVESVAWVAERKNVLSTFFWMLTMVAYASYAERPGYKAYLATLAFFIMGLMAKPMLVTLPFVLLLLDYWPLQRFGQRRAVSGAEAESRRLGSQNEGETGPGANPHSQGVVNDSKVARHEYRWAEVKPLVIEKIPFFILIPAFSALAYIAEGKAIKHHLPWSVKISNALVSCVIYIGKMVWPSNLAVYYPLSPWQFWQTAAAAFLLVAITGAVILMAKKYPFLVIGWLWFVGALVPVIGIVQIGNIARADRFVYVPLIGLFIMIAWGLPELLKRRRYRAQALGALSALVLSCLFILTWIQVGYWRNSFTLFDHALEVIGRNPNVHLCRGVAYSQVGDLGAAMKDFDSAIEINPQYADAYCDRGVVYEAMGDQKQAIRNFDRAIGIDPENFKAYTNRGYAYNKLGNQRKAIFNYNEAIQINPNAVKAYYNRGNSYTILGNLNLAIMDYDMAIKIDPEYAEAYYDRGVAYSKLFNYTQAMKDFNEAIDLNQEFVDAYFARGNVNCNMGNYRQAITDYDKTIKLNPKYADAYHNEVLPMPKAATGNAPLRT